MAAESHFRSIVKATSYRLMGTLVTAAIAYVVLGDVSSALKIGAADLVAKIFAFYIHERIWLAIPLGKAKPIEYEI